VGRPTESPLIQGVFTIDLGKHADGRGFFAEVFRKEWFPQRPWEEMQCNRSASRAGVVRALHYHRRQVDYWHCAAGHIRAGLYDLRRSSPTRGHKQVIDLDQDRLLGLFIPSGVAHGFLAITDATLFYIVDNYYDGADELGVAWDDPQIALPWGVEGAPILSERDARNPLLRDISPDLLPP